MSESYGQCKDCGGFHNTTNVHCGCPPNGPNDSQFELPYSELVDHNTTKSLVRDLSYERKNYPYRCPVCDGHGFVSAGFYNTANGYYFTGGTELETCRACNGTGIVWG